MANGDEKVMQSFLSSGLVARRNNKVSGASRRITTLDAYWVGWESCGSLEQNRLRAGTPKSVHFLHVIGADALFVEA